MSLRILHYSDVENAYDDPERIGRLAGLVDELRDESTLVAGTGDNTAPGVLSLISEGRHALDFFETVEPDAETFGNHDFDHGPAATRHLVRESPQTWVSANVRDDGERFGAEDGVVPTAVIEAGDYRVGLFGVTDPETAEMCPPARALTFTDPYAAAEEAVADLRDRGADRVVALSHLGRGDDELAAAVDVDAVLGGHVHEERVDRANDTLLTRPGANGTALFEVELDGEPTVTRHEVADGPLDETVVAALRARMARAGLDETVTTVADPIRRTRNLRYGGECRVGNAVADAFRWAADADVGFQNTGGIRDGPPLSGEVTVADLVGLSPFEERVCVAELDGTDLRALVEHVGGPETGDLGWYGHFSGVTIGWDAARESVEWLTCGGAPVAADETYTVATNSFVLDTGKRFPSLTEADRVATLDVQYDVLVDYVREVGLDHEIEGRIVTVD